MLKLPERSWVANTRARTQPVRRRHIRDNDTSLFNTGLVIRLQTAEGIIGLNKLLVKELSLMQKQVHALILDNTANVAV